MKLIKYASMLVLAGALVGCGGHGYEGEYEGKVGSSDKALNNMLPDSMPSQKIVIGTDYLEMESLGRQRQEFDIFVRESGEDKYLVFKDGKSELMWKILDENTLVQEVGLSEVKFVRVK
uniref:Uncharacterized protein n=1 Tax=Candidatus Kentrum sp. LFY TaxID=2126342 RepID=A0A450WYE3_9GAMM|nr:MAG: hypothetical protein BECKLFY1418C_GA0070996_11108 [Candidatus Kentron sp. LFY]